MNINKFFTDLEILEIKELMLAIQDKNGVQLRESAINLYNSGEAYNYDYKGRLLPSRDLASRAWTMAVLMHLEANGFEIVKKEIK